MESLDKKGKNMYNTKTKNTSFINMWRYLQEINVENNIFMLELKDESLIDFDTEYLSTCGQGERDGSGGLLHQRW